ncbi:uncharacterized protein F5147DRAFT_782401 [Suillus discolor]|uniref:Fungal-type protein kinase domain-containing protein n=1 Tax=Suillus discolor TaxID=1912936 RepID=A0A9P7ERM1_9AGAM|nr:uncharacterized protein F5147DRAFT_782401 [Suillus discolor]KAG2084645.1 hypothetical protein F5147DRAFT_782401 [Suillus discolor]
MLPENISKRNTGVPGALVVLMDIVKIQQTAVEEHQILHRDCSLNNAMILDELEGTSEGFLIDWEFAVRIATDHKYPIGGTGTVPFMSRGLLNQFVVLQQEADLESKKKQTKKKKETRGRNSVDKPKTPKSSSDSLALPVSYVIQGFADDLESLFSCSLGSASSLVVPTSGRRVLVDNMIHPVTFNTILAVLNSHLDKLPDDEELVSTVNMLKKDAVILTHRVKGKHIASDSPSVVAPKQQKSHHSDTESDSASGSDA